MGRLTFRNKYRKYYFEDEFVYVTELNSCDTQEALDKLADYEDIGTVEHYAELVKAEEERRLFIKPKCKDCIHNVGDYYRGCGRCAMLLWHYENHFEPKEV